jgi:hypothetical protein
MDAAAQAAVELRPMLPHTRVGHGADRGRPPRGWVLRQRDAAAGDGRRRRRLVRRAVARLPGLRNG